MNLTKVRKIGTNVGGYPVWLCRTTWGGWSVDEPNSVQMFLREADAVAFGVERLQVDTGPALMCNPRTEGCDASV